MNPIVVNSTISKFAMLRSEVRICPPLQAFPAGVIGQPGNLSTWSQAAIHAWPGDDRPDTLTVYYADVNHAPDVDARGDGNFSPVGIESRPWVVGSGDGFLPQASCDGLSPHQNVASNAGASRSQHSPLVSADPTNPYTGYQVPDAQDICLVPCKPTSRHRCVTQPDGQSSLKIGNFYQTSRWLPDSTLTYFIDSDRFPDENHAKEVAEAMLAAISMWNNKGVRFQLVADKKAAIFKVKRSYSNSGDLAKAFFPGDYDRKLHIFDLALQEKHRPFLANVLAHELGHIMGLRHEFAMQPDANEPVAYLLGADNAESIMNYADNLMHFRVTPQDLIELERFYRLKNNSKDLKWPLCDYPPLTKHQFR